MELITAAIQHSEIETIRRLPAVQILSLTTRICAMEQVKSLYGTQLQAFVAGLAGAVHCTQGPPGTGKVSLLLK